MEGQAGEYDLWDDPNFDDDVVINSAQYTSDVPGNTGPTNLGLPTWTLGTDIAIGAGVSHTYTLTVCVTMDLDDPSTGGDGVYTSCSQGNPGDRDPERGLHNTAYIDTDDDGNADDEDDACEDLPFITHTKDLGTITQTSARCWTVTYDIVVTNEGGASGDYDLWDDPQFDDDIMYNGSTLTSRLPCTGFGQNRNLAGQGPWQLANGEALASGTSHCYTLSFDICMDLEDAGSQGDERYDECGLGGGDPGDPSEGLYNATWLDLEGDGDKDEEDDACGDVPYIIVEKSTQSVTEQIDGSYDIVYTIKVTNLGGVADDYDLVDDPGYDDDITINSASYTTDAFPNAGNPGPFVLGGEPWTLATNSKHRS